MGNYKKTLLIGCGGSGIKTLIRLNQLLSSNPNYRNDVRENISYLVVDTNIKDLDGFDSTIRAQMGETGAPNIAQAHITSRFNNLNQIVRPNFDNLKGNEEALKKMRPHWMYTPDGEEPFRGNQIRNLEEGAGQCCQISYLSAWNYMPKLESILSDMVNEIRKRNSGEDSSQIQVFLVAGLAGGTGRGSWQLIAFKVRQFLQEQGMQADITAIFFDASCYPNVSSKARKEEKENLIVNSYMAMSELAAWLRLKKAKQYYYTLPYLDNPDSEVIKVYDDGNVANQSPVLRAFLIFGSNGYTGNLLNNAQYHDMAATALYSMVVYPGPVNEIFSNIRINIGSLGATTFEVDTYHLRSFFETAVQKKFLEKQCAELTDMALSAEVSGLIGAANSPEKDTFLGRSSLWLPENISATPDGVSLDFRDEDKNLSLLQSLMKEIDGNVITRSKQKINGAEVKVFNTQKIADELAKQKLDPVVNAINNALQVTNLDEDAVVTILNTVLAQNKLDGANLFKTLDKLVLDQFAPEGKAVSLSRSILFAKGLKKIFKDYQKVLAAGITVQGSQDVCVCDEDVAKILTGKDSGLVQKAFKEDNGFLGMGDKFNAKEIDSICSQFQYCMYAAIFFKFQPVLTEFYKKATEHLAVIEQALDDMVEILKNTSVVLDGNFEMDFGKITYDEIIDTYFINSEDSESVLKSIPDAASLKNVFYRQLKPIMSRDEINELLSDKQNVRINKKPIMEEIGKQLGNLLLISDATVKNKRFDSADEAKKILPKEFGKLIAANVHLEEKVGRKSFMEEHFSFEDVLDKNIRCWNKLLKESSSVQVANLKDQFRDFLGVSDSDYDEENCLNKENILKGIIKSLVRSSKPWIQVVQNSSSAVAEALDCTILVPVPISDTSDLANEIDRQNSDGRKSMRSHICCPTLNENTLNLPVDRIVVFNAEVLDDPKDFAPMDKIQNLTTWKQNSAVGAFLELAENPRENETAWFEMDKDLNQWVEKSRGMTYVSPIFAEDPLKRLRWHPWVKDTADSLEQQQLAKAHRALFYAFLGIGIEDTSALKQTLTGYNCEVPLLSLKGQDFIFNYPPRLWKDGKMDFAAKNRSWDVCDPKNKGKDARLEHSINHVIDYLCGKGFFEWRLNKGDNFQESKDTGIALCNSMNKEADDFFTNIFQNLGVADRKLLTEKLHDYLLVQRDATSKHDEDRPYWSALVTFTEDEAERLGVPIQ